MTASQPSYILTAARLKKQYRNGRGVEDISFSIRRGEIFGLLGANGAGKTTTMKIITGLITRYGGTVRLDGEDIAENPAKALRRMGCLVEAPSFYGYMSAEKNLKTAAAYYGMDKAKAESEIAAKLQLVKLYQFRKDKAAKYSLGMKQRLGLALAMIGDPEIYVLDEPANGMDIEGIVEIRNIILNLACERRASFLVSSHLAPELQKMCHRVGIIHDGALRETAEMDWILENYPSLEDYYLSVINSEGRRSINGGK
ncbi:MAG: ABC transporter ATP-binding protein [Clostridiales bacterium]|jgi:ABC-2 type transport system ATP-binding protein|nr:ABC transporter ATP-binding protein [Clostridiales bacterium]